MDHRDMATVWHGMAMDTTLMENQVSPIKAAIEIELAAAKQRGNLYAECDLRVHLAESLWLEKKHTESVQQYDTALSIAQKLNDDDKVGMIWAGKGFALLNVGEHIDTVLGCYEQSLAISHKIGHPKQAAFIQQMMEKAKDHWNNSPNAQKCSLDEHIPSNDYPEITMADDQETSRNIHAARQAEEQWLNKEAETLARVAEAELMSMLDGEQTLAPKQKGPLSKAQKKRQRQKQQRQQQRLLDAESQPQHPLDSEPQTQPQLPIEANVPELAATIEFEVPAHVSHRAKDKHSVGFAGLSVPNVRTMHVGGVGNCSSETHIHVGFEVAMPAAMAGQPIRSIDELNRAEVLQWIHTVDGLTVAQQVAAHTELAEDEYDGKQLAAATTKTLTRLLKGTAALEAVPLLLAASDAASSAAAAALVVETPQVQASSPQSASPSSMERPVCPVCFELYNRSTTVLPRVLIACGHSVCGGCLDQVFFTICRPILDE
jgi:hypothetical protein